VAGFPPGARPRTTEPLPLRNTGARFAGRRGVKELLLRSSIATKVWLAVGLSVMLLACGTPNGGRSDGGGDAGPCGAACIPAFRASWLAVPECFPHVTLCDTDAGPPSCLGTSANNAVCTWTDGSQASVAYMGLSAGDWNYEFDSASGDCLSVEAGRYHVCAGSAYTFGPDGGTYVVDSQCSHTMTCPDGGTVSLPDACLADLPSLGTVGGDGSTCAAIDVEPSGP